MYLHVIHLRIFYIFVAHKRIPFSVALMKLFLIQDMLMNLIFIIPSC